ncbi:MAG TPA: hypothetical protein PKW18_02160 [Candidatus Sumerlaeota bacterium]|nr:hypothetical protein [Candidatus Sumerlaeota bacterium]HRR30514.1 hypothetical protein [Candidatus Sumerlaeia bacterium]HON49049.1 hypothetical protein [Candidatus Sumerlaeota bacterium]HOR64343.1 hypothetical protein [Candidatus Sumerlaeota bacterium]HPL73362.1 hypothetical protein [Candidatus Sumerlaeota bacterium]
MKPVIGARGSLESEAALHQWRRRIFQNAALELAPPQHLERSRVIEKGWACVH